MAFVSYKLAKPCTNLEKTYVCHIYLVLFLLSFFYSREVTIVNHYQSVDMIGDWRATKMKMSAKYEDRLLHKMQDS